MTGYVSLEEAFELLAGGEKSSENMAEVCKNLVVTGATFAALFTGVDPFTALASGSSLSSLKAGAFVTKVCKLLSPSKKENIAFKRNQTIRIANSIILNVALRDNLRDESNTIERWRVQFEKSVTKKVKDALKEIEDAPPCSLMLYPVGQAPSVEDVALKIYHPILSIMESISSEKAKKALQVIHSSLIKSAPTYYYAYLALLCNEFPDVATWFDHEETAKLKEQIEKIRKGQTDTRSQLQVLLSQQTNLQKTLASIQKFQNANQNLDLLDLNELVKKLQKSFGQKEPKAEVIKDVMGHHNTLKRFAEGPLFPPEQFTELTMPPLKQMYIPQPYKGIFYNSQVHKKKFLDPNQWKGRVLENPMVGLRQHLLNPMTTTCPILVLGNPGSGKTLLTQMTAAQLISDPTLLPIYIKIKDIKTNSDRVDDYINEGLRDLSLGFQTNWVEWARAFPSRAPVLFLDGLDELIAATQKPFGSFLTELVDLQLRAKDHSILLRVVVSSRLTVMHQVNVPEGCPVLLLRPFDKDRKSQWIGRWNKAQSRHPKFQPLVLPENNADISTLSSEPLLLFLLAIYDFRDQGLSKWVNKKMPKSKIYSSLVTEFIYRQVEKGKLLQGEADPKRARLRLRLQLGLVAMTRFLDGKVHPIQQGRLQEVAIFFGFTREEVSGLFGDFFFIHKDDGGGQIAFDFIHKTFFEFLVGDFCLHLLLGAQENLPGMPKCWTEQDIVRLALATQWLHKEPELVDLMIEHMPNVFDNSREELSLAISEIQEDFKTSEEIARKQWLKKVNNNREKWFQDEIKFLLSAKRQPWPLEQSPCPSLMAINHLAIYSQNLILLWVAFKNPESLDFSMWEEHQNKKYWKQLVGIWEAAGSIHEAAAPCRWLKVSESTDHYLLHFSPNPNATIAELPLMTLDKNLAFRFARTQENVPEKIRNLVLEQFINSRDIDTGQVLIQNGDIDLLLDNLVINENYELSIKTKGIPNIIHALFSKENIKSVKLFEEKIIKSYMQTCDNFRTKI